MSKPEFVYVTYIATTPERLWEALTETRFTQEYWAGRAFASEWTAGAKVEVRKRSGELDSAQLEVLEIDRPKRLVLAWRHRAPSGETPPATRVTYDLEPAGPKNVKLTVTHESWQPGSSVDERVSAGWPAILSSLKTFLETGEALDITRRWEQSGN